MANRLLGRLRELTKKTGMFENTSTSVAYHTGFLPFDYANGYIIQARDDDDNLIAEYPNIGIIGGTFNTVIGKSGTAKTTAVAQWAASIVKPFENGFVVHIDLEQALSITRLKNITGLTNREFKDHYVLKQEKSYIEDIFDMIKEVADEKERYSEDYMYTAPFKNEFGEDVRLYVPTVFIIDSLPTLSPRPESKKDKESGAMIEEQEIKSGTHAMRVARTLAEFYKKLMPIVKTYNISLFCINHINPKIDINPFVKSQPQLLYLKTDEALPLGNTPIYYANNVFKFVAKGTEKKCIEDDGFAGFGVEVQFLKSRSNVAGQFVHMIYDQNTGFDRARTLLEFIRENGCVLGARKNARYFKDFPDIKFNEKEFTSEFYSRPELRKATMDTAMPFLEDKLSRVAPIEFQEDNFGIDVDLMLKVCE